MKQETIAALKEEMGYTEDPPANCKGCIHSQEIADTHVDRSWHRVCNIAIAVGSIPVKDHGVCNKHTRKS